MSIEVESVFNQEDDALPFAYYSPATEGKLTWICGEDADGRITSVFTFEGQEDGRKADILESKEKALFIRQTLIDDGWKKLIPPKVTITLPNGQDFSTLNRREKRDLVRRLKRKNNKENPFKR
jgi:hypothetical protein